jgi:hypothetical protein
MEYIKTTDTYGVYLDSNKTYGSLNVSLFDKARLTFFYSFHQFNLGIHIIFSDSHYSVDLNLGFVSVGVKF